MQNDTLENFEQIIRSKRVIIPMIIIILLCPVTYTKKKHKQYENSA